MYYTIRERLRIERAKRDTKVDRRETCFSGKYPPCENKSYKKGSKNISSEVAYTIEADAKSDDS